MRESVINQKQNSAREVHEALGETGPRVAEAVTVTVTVDQANVGYLIGIKGQTIKEMCRSSGASIWISGQDKGSPPAEKCEIEVKGTRQQVTAARTLILDAISRRKSEIEEVPAHLHSNPANKINAQKTDGSSSHNAASDADQPANPQDVSTMSVAELKAEIARSEFSSAEVKSKTGLQQMVIGIRDGSLRLARNAHPATAYPSEPPSRELRLARNAPPTTAYNSEPPPPRKAESLFGGLWSGARAVGRFVGVGAGANENREAFEKPEFEEEEYAETIENPWQSMGGKKLLSCIVIGETGAGKSTFVNTLTNFFKSGTLEELKIAIPTKYHTQTETGFKHSEQDLSDTSKSATDDCTTYTFTDSSSGRKFNIIDTPGLADTRGPAQDEKNIEKIMKAAEEAQSLSAIILVVNGAAARYTLVSYALIFRQLALLTTQ
jgi:GTP-binding protein EngB required for normal cell division